MPFVPKYTTSELNAVMEGMKKFPPEMVERYYRTGRISLKDKLFMLSNYGNAQREIAVRGDMEAAKEKTSEVKKLGGGGYSGAALGEAKFYGQNVMKEFKASWDAAVGRQELSDLVTGTVKKPAPAEAVFHAMMGSLEVLKGFDIPGDVVERWALEAFPDAPGFARLANWAVWMPTNFLGLTTILKAPFVGAGGAMRTSIKAAGAVADYGKYLKDPVAYVTKQAIATDAVLATKLAKATAESSTRKGAGVAGAAVEAEAKGGTQAFKTAEPKSAQTLYHGTPTAFDEFDLTKAESGLYGKGVYLTDDADIAAGYANPQGRIATLPPETIKSLERQIADPNINPRDKATLQDILTKGQPAPNVRPVYANVKNSFDIDAGALDEKLLKQIPESFYTSASSRPSTNGDLYRDLVKVHGEDKTTQILKTAGYDSITHEGGVVSGGVKHRVTIAFDPKQVVSKLDPIHFAAPQELEQMATSELIKHYEERAVGMIRSKSAGGPGVSHAETRAAADAAPNSFEEIVKRGPDAPISATELEAIGRVHDQVSKAFNAVLDEASNHIPDIARGSRPDLVQAYKSHLAAMEVTNPAFMSGRGQTGRGLEYMKTMQDLVGESKVFDTLTRSLSSEKLLEGSDQAVAYTMNKLYQLGKVERAKLVEEGTKDYSPGTLRLLYKSMIFARPGTHVANLAGNTASIVLHGTNKSASALMPWSEVTTREASAYWTGMWDTRNKFFEMYQKASEASGKNLSKAGIEGTATGSMVKYGPLGWLGFEDEMMQGVVSHGLAKSQAIKEGLSKWDELQAAAKAGTFELPQGTTKKSFLDNFTDSSLNDPHNYERLSGEIEKEADYIIFHSPLSHGGELAAKAIREGWGGTLDYMMPVVKFPINAMKMARDWTPGLQMISKDFVGAVAEGGARADAARSRMALSWMISSQVYEGAKAGIITGDGPVNAEANAVWRNAGNTPRTIHGLPIQWAEPLATWFAFVADLAHNSNEMTEDNLSNAFQAVLTSGYQAVENNYFLRIMEGVTGSLSDVKRVKDLNDIMGAGLKVVGQPLKTLATGGPIGRAVGEMINPEAPDMKIYGELGDLKNWFFAGTPFGTDTRPRLNFSGKTALVPPMIGAQWIKDNLGAPDWLARGVTSLLEPPMRQNLGEEDPVAQFMDKHGLTLHSNWKYYGGSADIESPLPMTSAKPRVSLSGDQAFNWNFIALNDARQYGTNRSWNEAVTAMDTDPRFLAKPLNEKQQEFNRLYATFRRSGLDMLRKIDPDVQAKEKERDLAEAQQRNRPTGLFQNVFGSSAETNQAPTQEEQVEHPVQVAPTMEAPQ